MPIPAEALTQLTNAYDYSPILALVSGDVSNFTYTANSTTDILTATGHDFVNGVPVRFTNTGGALPGGIVADTDYFVVNVSGDNFQISATVGGAVVALTSNGSGTNIVTERRLGDGDVSTDLIREYTDASIIWDVLVRHEVDYEGAGRVAFDWGVPSQDLASGRVSFPNANVSVIPVTGTITFRYVVILRDAVVTTGDNAGKVSIARDMGDTTISLQGQTFVFSPYYQA
jgi:hypothetical protein